jgi:hypothetical protein
VFDGGLFVLMWFAGNGYHHFINDDCYTDFDGCVHGLVLDRCLEGHEGDDECICCDDE